MLTAFCNDGESPVLAPMIELLDVGAFEIFNPGRCSNGLGGSEDRPEQRLHLGALEVVRHAG